MSDSENAAIPWASMLPEYLTGRAEKLYEANARRRVEMRSAEAWEAQKRELRERFTASLGGFPERQDLSPRITGIIDRDSYAIEKVILESHPGVPVTANLYIPKGLDGPAPAVLVPCGHSGNGKACEAYQKVCIDFALNGIVALIYDPISQGERVQYYDEELGKSRVGSCTTEHSQIHNQCVLSGNAFAKYRIWDGMRCLDYLETRAEVDRDRLGCTGCSGGGTLTAYLSALDERIKVSMPVCYITSLQARQESDMVADGEQQIFGQLAYGMDHHEYLAMVAPRPLRIGAAAEDFFPIRGTAEAGDFARKIYDLYGAKNDFDIFVGPGGHGYSDAIRDAAMEWFGRYFDMPMDRCGAEAHVLADEKLQCTESGQVETSGNSRKIFEVNLAQWVDANARQAVAPRPDETARVVGDTLDIECPVICRHMAVAPAEAGFEGYEGTEYYVVGQDEGLRAGVFVRSANADTVRLIVDAEPDYAEFEATTPAGEDIALLTACGTGLSDLSGHGLQNVQPQGGNVARLLGREAFAAYFAEIMGFSLLKLRVYDVLAAVRFLRAQYGYREIILDARGRGGIWALHAAVLDGDVSVRLTGTLWSYELIMRDGENTAIHMADIARGSLRKYDLPDLCTALPKGKLAIVAPVDGRGQSFDPRGRAGYAAIEAVHGAGVLKQRR